MNKYDFMQDMLTRACNRHRAEMGLEPVDYSQMEKESTGEPPAAPDAPLDWNQRCPMPIVKEKKC